MASTYSMSDYLNPTPEAIEGHLKLIRKRTGEEKRPVFTPVETLLCCGLAFVVNRRKYGGNNLDRVPSPIPELARFMKRTPGSLLAKMGNCDGAWPNGAAHDMEIASYWWSNVSKYAEVYSAIVTVARSLGIGPDEIPDFLHLVDGDAATPIIGGADDSPRVSAQTLQESEETTIAQAQDIAREVKWSVEQSEKYVVARTRIGQQRFAREVLSAYGNACALCGLAPAALGTGQMHRLLVASHVKPWRDSVDRERLDPNNGIAACPLHDVAFDQGLVTVDADLHVVLSPRLVLAMENGGQFAHFFAAPGIRESVLIPEGNHGPNVEYLHWHRDHVFLAA